MDTLSEFFSPLDLATFGKKYLFREPFAATASALRYRKLIGWNLLFEIFEAGHKDCWLAKKGNLPTIPQLATGALDLLTAKRGFEDGYTIVVRHSEKAHEDLKSIAIEFESHFGKPVDIQLYCTPEGEQGFDWHYDLEDVFVIQSSGAKEFRLRKNIDESPPSFTDLPKTLVLEDHATGPEIRCVLKAGDVLYIPSGYWHCARALTPSFHLSVGVMFR